MSLHCQQPISKRIPMREFNSKQHFKPIEKVLLWEHISEYFKENEQILRKAGACVLYPALFTVRVEPPQHKGPLELCPQNRIRAVRLGGEAYVQIPNLPPLPGLATYRHAPCLPRNTHPHSPQNASALASFMQCQDCQASPVGSTGLGAVESMRGCHLVPPFWCYVFCFVGMMLHWCKQCLGLCLQCLGIDLSVPEYLKECLPPNMR